MEILRRIERAMVKAMCGAKLMKKNRTEDLVKMFGLQETVLQMAKANRVRWYGHELRRDDRYVLRKASEFEVKGKRKQGQLKKTWKTEVERESTSVDLKKRDAIERDGELKRFQSKWDKSETPFKGINPDQNWFNDDDDTI